MYSSVNEQRRIVVTGSGADRQQWPFTLDLRRGTAHLAGSAEWSVRPQRWSEKLRLAQFAHLGEAFVREQLWQMCVAPRNAAAEGAEREALLALAAWLSCGGSAEALALDPAALARVTATACRSLGVGPAELASMPAYQVESLWRHAAPGATSPANPETRGNPAESEFDHKIIVVPDPIAMEATAARSPEVRDPEAVEASGGTAPETEAASKPAIAEPWVGPAVSTLGPESAAQPPSAAARSGVETEEQVPVSGAGPSLTSSPSKVEPDGAKVTPRPSPTHLSRFRVVMNPPAKPAAEAPRLARANGAASRTKLGAKPQPSSQQETSQQKPQHNSHQASQQASQQTGQQSDVPSIQSQERRADESNGPQIATAWSKPEWLTPPFATSAELPLAPQPEPSFDDFSETFAERLEHAALELGIFVSGEDR